MSCDVAVVGAGPAGISAAYGSLEAEDTSARFLARYEKKWCSLPLADSTLIKTAEIVPNSSQKQWDKIGETRRGTLYYELQQHRKD